MPTSEPEPVEYTIRKQTRVRAGGGVDDVYVLCCNEGLTTAAMYNPTTEAIYVFDDKPVHRRILLRFLDEVDRLLKRPMGVVEPEKGLTFWEELDA